MCISQCALYVVQRHKARWPVITRPPNIKKKVVIVMSMLPEFSKGSFWPGIEGDGAQKSATVVGIVREGLREIITCALEPLFPADLLINRK